MTPEKIKATRKRYELSPAEAARLVHVDPRSWRRWEDGTRKMPAGAWELFKIKIGGTSNDR